MSAYSNEYRELIEGAYDAIHKLLTESTPDSWMGLRSNYTVLRQTLERDAQEPQQEQKRYEQDEGERIRREQAEIRKRRDLGWKRLPRERRESALFQVLGDEGLTLRWLASRMEAGLGVRIYESDLRYPVKRMFSEGQLERVEETFRNKPRYRYFRKRGLDGPIVDLERAYHHEDGGEV